MRQPTLSGTGVLSAALVFLALGGARAAEPERPEVLILNSYHLGYSWSDEEMRGLFETLRVVRPDVELEVEYLDAKHFPEQFLHAPARRTQRLTAQRSYPVHAPRGFPVALRVRAQIALAFQAVQDGIKGSGTQFVPMARQLLSDPSSVKRLFGRVMEDVQSDQPRVETLIIHIDFRCPVSISKLSIE